MGHAGRHPQSSTRSCTRLRVPPVTLPSHRKVIHIILSQNTLCKRLFIHIRELLAPPNTICMCKRANFNMYRVVVSAYLYIFENSWPNRILYVCLYFRWRCTRVALHVSQLISWIFQKTREGCGCPKFPAGKVFRQISTLLEN